MALVVAIALREVSSWIPGAGAGSQLVRLTVTIGFGLLAVALSAKLLRISEFDEVVDRIRERLRQRATR
jgi:hypothetical protein